MPAPVPDNLIRKLNELNEQFEELGRMLLDPETLADHRRVREVSVKRAAIEPVVKAYTTYLDTALAS